MKRRLGVFMLLCWCVLSACVFVLVSAAFADIKNNRSNREAEQEKQLQKVDGSGKVSYASVINKAALPSGPRISPIYAYSDAYALYLSEGGSNAYNFYGWRRFKASNPGGIGYGVTQVSGDYLTAAKYAFGKMSAVSSGINVYASSKGYYSPGDKYTVAAANQGPVGYNAINNMNCTPSGGYALVTESHILYNTYYMNSYTLDAKKMLAMHELGHTFGLRDIYASEQAYSRNMTVMKYDYSSGYHVFLDYTDFDKMNLRYAYGY
ncbi:MAG: hypothetical protein J5643_11595 [Lachnospiraceae bacterium]|nr:hypothetical protein [Lachnospiraceae bacterium]